jgi:hypothetical protein
MHWIDGCLDAIVAQSIEEWECIVVDDGSADATRDAVGRRTGSDGRIRLIQQANAGQSAAINRGVHESCGDYIKIIDADDWINPRHLGSQLRSLEGTDDLVSCCSWGYFREDPLAATGRVEQVDRNYEDPLEWLVDSLTIDEGMMGGWRWLIPRGIWERSGGYDERLSLNNDFDFSIRLLLASRGVRFAPGALYGYRKGVAGALSGSGGRKAMESAFLTTQLGCASLLAREDSPRIRRICASRWQEWLYRFYPEFPDLAERAEETVRSLGGSGVRMQGGILLHLLEPALGWRAVRRLQTKSRELGWKRILSLKERHRHRLNWR